MQHRVRKTSFGVATAALLLTASACGDSSTGPGGEQELITRVTLTVTPALGGTEQVIYIDDPDGLGPTPPSAQVGDLTLLSGALYTGTVMFENRLSVPPEDITEEVAAESDEHGVIYTVAGTAAQFIINDTDNSGRPLGITTSVEGGSVAGDGTVRVVLCHYDAVVKPASATTCTGDTDIDVTFSFSVVDATVQRGN